MSQECYSQCHFAECHSAEWEGTIVYAEKIKKVMFHYFLSFFGNLNTLVLSSDKLATQQPLILIFYTTRKTCDNKTACLY